MKAYSAPTMIIDEPSPFASLAEWRGFLDEMEKLRRNRPDDDMVAAYLDLAQRTVADKEAEEA